VVLSALSSVAAMRSNTIRWNPRGTYSTWRWWPAGAPPPAGDRWWPAGARPPPAGRSAAGACCSTFWSSTCSSRLPAAAACTLVQAAEMLRAEGSSNKQKIEAKSGLENYLFTLHNTLQEKKLKDKFEPTPSPPTASSATSFTSTCSSPSVTFPCSCSTIATATGESNKQKIEAKSGLENYCFALHNTPQEEKLQDKFGPTPSPPSASSATSYSSPSTCSSPSDKQKIEAMSGLENYCFALHNTPQEEKLKDKFRPTPPYPPIFTTAPSATSSCSTSTCSSSSSSPAVTSPCSSPLRTSSAVGAFIVRHFSLDRDSLLRCRTQGGRHVGHHSNVGGGRDDVLTGGRRARHLRHRGGSGVGHFGNPVAVHGDGLCLRRERLGGYRLLRGGPFVPREQAEQRREPRCGHV